MKPLDPENHRLRKFVGRLLHHGSDSRTGSPNGSAYASGATTPHGRGSSPNSKVTAASKSRPDARISLELWNEAYNSLRDGLRTAGLVTVYESILSQEIPNGHAIGGMNLSLGRTDDDRFTALTSITDAGLRKAHNSTNSQVDASARLLLQSSKDMIKSMLVEYPSTAVAWSGICVLTPLLVDPIMHRENMRRGALHVLGRIQWYMYLTGLLLPGCWKSDHDFHSQQASLRDQILTLYRKVLEFEMNCVCATAGSWNHAAKNVVGWQALNELVTTVKDLDVRLAESIDGYIGEVAKKELLGRDHDLDLGESNGTNGGGVGRCEQMGEVSRPPSRGSRGVITASTEVGAQVAPAPVRV